MRQRAWCSCRPVSPRSSGSPLDVGEGTSSAIALLDRVARRRHGPRRLSHAGRRRDRVRVPCHPEGRRRRARVAARRATRGARSRCAAPSRAQRAVPLARRRGRPADARQRRATACVWPGRCCRRRPDDGRFTGWVQTIPKPPAPTWVDGERRRQPGARRSSSGLTPSAPCATGREAYEQHHRRSLGTGGAFQVPPLVGVGWRTPLMHNGCAATIAERFGGLLRSTPQQEHLLRAHHAGRREPERLPRDVVSGSIPAPFPALPSGGREIQATAA